MFTKSTSARGWLFFVRVYRGKRGVDLKLTINGELREVTDVTSIADLLVAFKLEQKILVIELNREIIDRSAYAATALSEGDSLEIVHFVGGG